MYFCTWDYMFPMLDPSHNMIFLMTYSCNLTQTIFERDQKCKQDQQHPLLDNKKFTIIGV